MGLITFAQVTRAGGHGSGGGRSFGRNLGSMNRGPDLFVGMHGSINRGRGADDLANHNANDDRGRNRGPGNGGVTPTPDDHGNAGVGHR
jgi:hypothetical protein